MQTYRELICTIGLAGLLLSGAVGTMLILRSLLSGQIFRIRKKFPGCASTFRLDMLKREFEIEEQIFQKISLDLHDQVGHSLSLAKLHLTTLIEDGCFHTDKIAYSVSLISRSLEELRHISRNLNSDNIICHGLIKTLEHTLQQAKDAGGFLINFQVTGSPCFLDDRTELAIFRIAQECLSNIIRHAGASAIDVHLHYDNAHVSLAVSDNGLGFNVSKKLAATNHSTSGLSNIIKRASLMDASHSITSQENSGTTIRIKIPLHDNRPGLFRSPRWID